MEMESPLAYIFDAIDKSDAENKDKMKSEVWSCISDFITYFRCVVGENFYYSSTPKEEQRAVDMIIRDRHRRSNHDLCMYDCAVLNMICSSLNINNICDFDLDDRAKVAQFCGYIVSSLYFGNIRKDDEVDEWMSSFPLVKGD